MGSCSECSGYGGNCPVCQEEDIGCPNCTIGVLIDDGGCLECDNCLYCEVYYDPDTEYDERRINEK